MNMERLFQQQSSPGRLNIQGMNLVTSHTFSDLLSFIDDHPEIEEIDMSGCNLESDVVDSVAGMIASNREHLKSLSLSECGLKPEQVDLLINSLSDNTALETLDLRYQQ